MSDNENRILASFRTLTDAIAKLDVVTAELRRHDTERATLAQKHLDAEGYVARCRSGLADLATKLAKLPVPVPHEPPVLRPPVLPVGGIATTPKVDGPVPQLVKAKAKG